MADRLKPNFTPIPNVILDEIMRTLAPGATKVLFAICRFTYGWGKRADRISLNQLAEITGMDRANVARSVKQLVPLVTIKPGDRRKSLATEYAINVEIADADLVSNKHQPLVSQQQHPGVRPSVNLRPSKDIQRKNTKNGAAAPERVSKNRPEKSRLGDDEVLAGFADFWVAYPRRVARAAAERAWSKLKPTPELASKITASARRYAAESGAIDPRYIPHAATWINGRRWDDYAESAPGAEPRKKSKFFEEFDRWKREAEAGQ